MPAGEPDVAPGALPRAPAPRRRVPSWLPLAMVLVAGLVVFLPAIRAPLALDDYFQGAMIEGKYPTSRSPFDLYDFVGDADRTLLLDRGLIPWWSHPRLKVRFLRPLSSILLYGDRRVFGDRPLLAHLHSFAWWMAAVLAARALYRRILGRRAAFLALLIFALASCHVLPIAWLAHRDAAVSITFGLLGLGALVRVRDRPTVASTGCAVVLLSLCLLGGEYGLCFGGYALAVALTGRARRPVGRALAVLSFAVPATVYLLVREKLGYGTEGSGLYNDPFREPAAFVLRLPRRLVTLLGEGWFALDGDLLGATTPAWALALLATLGVALLFVPLRRALASLDEDRRGHARWLLLGSLLSLAPVLAVAPSSRVLGASFIGIAAVVALILDRAWFPPVHEPRVGASDLSGLVALGLAFAHLVHAPATSWISGRAFQLEAQRFADRIAELRTRIAARAPAEVVLVRSQNADVWVLPYALGADGAPPPRWRVLALAGHLLMIRRDARTLELVANRDASLFPIGEGNLFREEGMAFAAGDVVRIQGMRMTILDVGDAGPRRARFELDGALESPSRIWLTDRSAGLEVANLPEIGFGKSFEP